MPLLLTFAICLSLLGEYSAKQPLDQHQLMPTNERSNFDSGLVPPAKLRFGKKDQTNHSADRLADQSPGKLRDLREEQVAYDSPNRSAPMNYYNGVDPAERFLSDVPETSNKKKQINPQNFARNAAAEQREHRGDTKLDSKYDNRGFPQNVMSNAKFSQPTSRKSERETSANFADHQSDLKPPFSREVLVNQRPYGNQNNDYANRDRFENYEPVPNNTAHLGQGVRGHGDPQYAAKEKDRAMYPQLDERERSLAIYPQQDTRFVPNQQDLTGMSQPFNSASTNAAQMPYGTSQPFNTGPLNTAQMPYGMSQSNASGLPSNALGKTAKFQSLPQQSDASFFNSPSQQAVGRSNHPPATGHMYQNEVPFTSDATSHQFSVPMASKAANQMPPNSNYTNVPNYQNFIPPGVTNSQGPDGRAHQQTDGRSLAHQQPDGRSHQQPDGRSLAHQQPDGRSLARQQTDGRPVAYQQPDVRSLAHQQPDGRSLARQQTDGRSVAYQQPDGRSLAHQQLDHRSLTHQLPDGRSLAHQLPNDRSLAHQQPDGRALAPGSYQGPTLTDNRSAFMTDNRGVQLTDHLGYTDSFAVAPDTTTLMHRVPAMQHNVPPSNVVPPQVTSQLSSQTMYGMPMGATTDRMQQGGVVGVPYDASRNIPMGTAVENLPQNNAMLGGIPHNTSVGIVPQNNMAIGEIPQGTVVGRIPQGIVVGGLPQNTAHGGISQGMAVGGLPQVTMVGGLPQGTMVGGIPQSTMIGGVPQSTMIGGLPQGSMVGGLPQGVVVGGLPQGTVVGGLPQGAVVGGLPQGAVVGVLPQGAVVGGLPQGSVAAGATPGTVAGHLSTTAVPLNLSAMTPTSLQPFNTSTGLGNVSGQLLLLNFGNLMIIF